MAQIALSVAFLSVSAMLQIPFFAIPLTLQSFAVFAVLGLLGWKKGATALLLYVALGAVGIPVFSGFGGGLGALFGPTGGFLFGFLLASPVYGAFEHYARCGGKKKAIVLSALGMTVGMLLSYLAGSLWYYTAYSGGASFGTVLSLTVLPFLIPDAVKIALALLVTRRLKRHIE
jgi:biotin transport system substrate-specific component